MTTGTEPVVVHPGAIRTALLVVGDACTERARALACDEDTVTRDPDAALAAKNWAAAALSASQAYKTLGDRHR